MATESPVTINISLCPSNHIHFTMTGTVTFNGVEGQTELDTPLDKAAATLIANNLYAAVREQDRGGN